METKNNAGFRDAEDADDADEAPILTEEDAGSVEIFHGNTFIKRGHPRPPGNTEKELISVRLDLEVAAKLREAGPGWQSQVNSLLRVVLGFPALEK